MKRLISMVLLFAMVLILSSPMSGYARGFGGHRSRGHIVVHGGYGWGWFPWVVGGAMVGATLGAPYRYPPPVVVQAPPPVYIQPEQQTYYWYYCQDPQGYYPYIQSCPNGWMKVVPDMNPPNQQKETAK